MGIKLVVIPVEPEDGYGFFTFYFGAVILVWGDFWLF